MAVALHAESDRGGYVESLQLRDSDICEPSWWYWSWWHITRHWLICRTRLPRRFRSWRNHVCGRRSRSSIRTDGAGSVQFVGFNDVFFMSLMFFLSGLFVWQGLTTERSRDIPARSIRAAWIAISRVGSDIGSPRVLSLLSADLRGNRIRCVLSPMDIFGKLAGRPSLVPLGIARFRLYRRMLVCDRTSMGGRIWSRRYQNIDAGQSLCS